MPISYSYRPLIPYLPTLKPLKKILQSCLKTDACQKENTRTLIFLCKNQPPKSSILDKRPTLYHYIDLLLFLLPNMYIYIYIHTHTHKYL